MEQHRNDDHQEDAPHFTNVQFVFAGNVKYIEKLLKMKPDLLNYSGHSGHSISELSVLWNRSESVEALFKAGANFTVPDDDGKCPQVLANEIGYTELANYIDELG